MEQDAAGRLPRDGGDGGKWRGWVVHAAARARRVVEG